MSGHTPGPWTVGDMDHDTDLDAQVAILWENRGTEREWVPVLDLEGVVALAHPTNARLISAAPDMLEALRVIEAQLTAAARAFYGAGKRSALQAALDGWVADAESARAAILNAEGRA